MCSGSLELAHFVMRESMGVVDNSNIECIDFMIAVSNVVCHLSRVTINAHPRLPPKLPPPRGVRHPAVRCIASVFAGVPYGREVADADMRAES
jgi:hypothetical protein